MEWTTAGLATAAEHATAGQITVVGSKEVLGNSVEFVKESEHSLTKSIED